MSSQGPRPSALAPSALLAALGLGACGGGVDAADPAAAGAAPPSILLVSIDTLRADRVGTYGYERDTTPFLDRLADESIVFERAQSPAPYTLVSHMTMLTGLHPRQHGVLREGVALAPQFPILAERLQDAGYQTAALFFPGWIDERFGFHRGFDTFVPHRDAEQAEEHLLDWLDQVDRNEPWMLFVHLFDVHCAPLDGGTDPLYDPPPPFDRLFIADAPDRLAGLDRSDIWYSPETLTTEQVDAVNAMYDGAVRYVDTKLSEWLEPMERAGMLDDTLVIVTSDHGESLGQRDGLMNGHGSVYQDGLHVPLIVRPPGGLSVGRRVNEAVGLVDLAPTFLDAAGLSRDDLPGRSLLDVAEAADDSVAVFNSKHAGLDVLTRWPWKVVSSTQADAAFHLELDPAERTPIYGDLTQNLKREMERDYRASLGTSPEQLEVVDAANASPEQLEELRALGYLDDE